MTTMNPATPRLFGTDGVRGRAGEGWLTPEHVASIGRAIGVVVGAKPRPRERRTQGPRALLGHDGRRSGPELLCALGRGLAEAGFASTSAGLITTPGLALVGRLAGFDVAVMVSASHNPACDNGIKPFLPSGEKLSDEDEHAVERAFAERQGAPIADAPAPPLDPDLERKYLDHLVGAAEGKSFEGLRLVIDCANGGGSRVAPRVFGRLGAQVVAVADQPDGDNINDGCGATDLALLRRSVVAHEAHLGIALDGDGDRCMLVDERGHVVDGDGILMLLAIHARAQRELRDPRIVATVMSNRGLHRALREHGISIVTVGVGDRRVVEALRREKLMLGGEQSGHVVFGGDRPLVGDGIYTALRCVRVLRAAGKPLSALAAPYRPFPQVLLNVRVASKPDLGTIPAIARAVADAEAELGEDGRVLLRYSGTEPLARVMVEGPDDERIEALARRIADLVAAEVGAA